MVKYIPSGSLSFPVRDAEKQNDGQVILSFMGLTGVDSPLPSYIKFSPLLSLLNNKIYQLFFKAIHKTQSLEKYSGFIKNSFGNSRQNVEKNLKKYFKNIKIILYENIPVWIPLDKIEQKNQTLGESVLGERVCVRGFKLKIPRCVSLVVVGQWIMR